MAGPPVGIPCRLPQKPERVRACPARRRRERAEEELVVERVRDRAEDPQGILDLLLRPIAAAPDDVRREAGSLQRLLERVHVGEGAQENDHVAGPHPVVGERPKPLCQEARLGDVRGVGLRGRWRELDLLGPPGVASSLSVVG